MYATAFLYVQTPPTSISAKRLRDSATQFQGWLPQAVKTSAKLCNLPIPSGVLCEVVGLEPASFAPEKPLWWVMLTLPPNLMPIEGRLSADVKRWLRNVPQELHRASPLSGQMLPMYVTYARISRCR